MELIKSGTVTTGNSVLVSKRTTMWKVMATTAASVTITLYTSADATGPSKVVTIPAINTSFVEIPGSFQAISVTGATVSYMVFA
jgi:hypothetical protein